MEQPINAIPERKEEEQSEQKVEEQKIEQPKPEVKPELPKKLVEQPKKIAGPPKPGRMERLKGFITECKRVLRVTKKPSKDEFKTIVKVSALGMAIIGIIGFLVHFAKELLF